MLMHAPSANALWTAAIFAAVYFFVILRETAGRKLDFYDLLILSAVAVVPLLFAFLPDAPTRFSYPPDIQLPAIVMFGLLFVALFTFINRLAVQAHEARCDTVTMVQELSLLRLELSTMKAAQSIAQGQEQKP